MGNAQTRFNDALDALVPFARVIYLGQSSGKTAQIDPWRLTAPNHSVIGFYIAGYQAVPGLIAKTLTDLIGFIATGKLQVQVSKFERGCPLIGSPTLVMPTLH